MYHWSRNFENTLKNTQCRKAKQVNSMFISPTWENIWSYTANKCNAMILFFGKVTQNCVGEMRKWLGKCSNLLGKCSILLGKRSNLLGKWSKFVGEMKQMDGEVKQNVLGRCPEGKMQYTPVTFLKVIDQFPGFCTKFDKYFSQSTFPHFPGHHFPHRSTTTPTLHNIIRQ